MEGDNAIQGVGDVEEAPTADELGEKLYNFIDNEDPEQATVLAADPRCNVNWVDDNGDTPLIWAAYRGYSDVVEVLLRREELLVNHQERRGDSALMWASQLGNTRCVELLLLRGTSPPTGSIQLRPARIEAGIA